MLMNSHPMKACMLALTALAAVLCTNHNKSLDLKGSTRLLLAADPDDTYTYKKLYDGIEPKNLLGSGTSAQVYDLCDGNVMKRLKPEHFKERKLNNPMREIMLSKCLKNHPNVILPYTPLPTGVDDFTEYGVFHVMPKADTDLHKLFTNGEEMRKVDDDFIQSGIFDVLRGLTYLHSANVAHRDLKLENILYGKGTMMICDFDLSRALPVRHQVLTLKDKLSIVGTRAYIPPEMAWRRGYTCQADLWSLGCVLAEMYAYKLCFGYAVDIGKPDSESEWTKDATHFSKAYGLFSTRAPGDHPNDYHIRNQHKIEELLTDKTLKDRKKLLVKQLEKSIKLAITASQLDKKWQPDSAYISKALPKELLDLLAQLLDPNPVTRITAEEALNHQFFEDAREEKGNDIPECNESTRQRTSQIESEIGRLIKKHSAKVKKPEADFDINDKFQVLYETVQWMPSTNYLLVFTDTQIRKMQKRFKILELEPITKHGRDRNVYSVTQDQYDAYNKSPKRRGKHLSHYCQKRRRLVSEAKRLASMMLP